MYRLLLLCACWCAGAWALSAQYYALEDAALHFDNFTATFGKKYADEHERERRFQIFKDNLKKANTLNKESTHAVYGITQFMDLTSKEFSQAHGFLSAEPVQDIYCKMVQNVPNANAPDSLDWRSKNAVTGVKNQGQCGSCWAFSAAAHLEGQMGIAHGQLVDLSEQQIIDCDDQSKGCRGGLPSLAFQALMKLGGAMKLSDYPYQAQTGTCQSDPSKAVLRVNDCTSYDLQSQDDVKQLLSKKGPISIAIRADALQTHQGGIIDDQTCQQGDVDHAVLLVGYGTEGDSPYWIVKNSWGADWGESGYFRMQRGGGQDGACGMLNKFMATADVA